jgi:hypothetical protein
MPCSASSPGAWRTGPGPRKRWNGHLAFPEGGPQAVTRPRALVPRVVRPPEEPCPANSESTKRELVTRCIGGMATTKGDSPADMPPISGLTGWEFHESSKAVLRSGRGRSDPGRNCGGRRGYVRASRPERDCALRWLRVFSGAPGGFGFAVINASAGGSVSATVSLKKQEPNRTYVVRLIQGIADCLTADAEVTTNGDG